MGIRSLIYFQKRVDGTDVIYVVIYQQYDGYLNGVGKNLAAFLNNAVFVNGIDTAKSEMKDDRFICNGFEDLIALYIRKNKDNKAGGLYIYPAIPCQEEEFTYYVTDTTNGIKVKVNKSDEMSIKEFTKLCL